MDINIDDVESFAIGKGLQDLSNVIEQVSFRLNLSKSSLLYSSPTPRAILDLYFSGLVMARLCDCASERLRTLRP